MARTSTTTGGGGGGVTDLNGLIGSVLLTAGTGIGLTPVGNGFIISSPSGSLSASRTLTSAEILQLASTPIQIIPPPGVGKAIFITFVKSKLNFGGIAYAGNPQDLRFKIGTVVTATILDAIFTNTADSTFMVNIGGVQGRQLQENIPLMVTSILNPTLGNGTIDVYVEYEIITL